jgi:hypothetical protein
MSGQIQSHRAGLALWWVGNAGWLVKSDDVLIATDLDLEPTGKVHEPPITAAELADVEIPPDRLIVPEPLRPFDLLGIHVEPIHAHLRIRVHHRREKVPATRRLNSHRLQPAYIFPQHYGTYLEEPDNIFWTRGYPDELEQQLPGTLRRRFHRLRQGEKFVIEQNQRKETAT